jgi:flagellum-specific ATP synthase
MDEPVSDTVRGILDGHIILSRSLFDMQHYPAIDILGSISRLALKVAGPEAGKAAALIRQHMAVYAGAEDLISVGAYHSGTNPAIDEAIAKHGEINDFLTQRIEEKSPLAETFARMSAISGVDIRTGQTDAEAAANQDRPGTVPSGDAGSSSGTAAGPAFPAGITGLGIGPGGSAPVFTP